MSDQKCPRCDGAGTLTCPRCNGKGYYEIHDNFITDTIKYITGNTEFEDCSNCNGDGEIQCNKCGGTGVIDDDD